MSEQTQSADTSITLNNVSILKNRVMDQHVEKMSRDMKFFSIFYIVYGAIMCLTIVGAIIGIPMIIYHLKLKEAGESFSKFTGTNDFFHLNQAFENQRKFFFFYKILLIISLVIIVLYIGVLIYLFTQGIFSMIPTDFA